MAVAIRLRREGSKNRPFYRVVVADKKNRRDGRFLEILGTYNPTSPLEKNWNFNVDRAEEWVGRGAQPSETVRNLIRKARRWQVDHPEGEEEQKPAAKVEPTADEPTATEKAQDAAAEAKAQAPKGEDLQEAPVTGVEAEKAADNADEKLADEAQADSKAEAVADEVEADQKDQPKGDAKEQEKADTSS